MEIRPEQFIGNRYSHQGTSLFQGIDAASGEALPTSFYGATLDEADQAAVLASAAFDPFRKQSGQKRGAFLRKIAENIEALGETLIVRAMAESGFPEARLVGERGRTCNQLRVFAEVVEKGDYVEARIDTALPDRKPLPRPDVRTANVGIGPVAVFGASNFPLAFSVAGTDTVSAFAAGCPVVVKAHPAHPGTSALVAQAIVDAVQSCGMPEGTFSMLQEKDGFQVAQALVKHPAIKAVGFTGSLKGGRALFDLAASRPEPIPVYAEMGSVNPVFILPNSMKEKGESIAQGWVQSLTMGTGQFCTNPGMVIAPQCADTAPFLKTSTGAVEQVEAGVMLHKGILKAYESGLDHFKKQPKVSTIATGKAENNRASASLLKTDAQSLLGNPALSEEVFGPSSLIVEADSKTEIIEIAKNLEGHLTATIWGEESDLEEYAELVEILEKKVGRILFNGYPTGVEVCDAMVHGGPYPATSDGRSTSVGTSAIKRFLRPVCYQDAPQSILPECLRDQNEAGIMRLVNGEWNNSNC